MPAQGPQIGVPSASSPISGRAVAYDLLALGASLEEIGQLLPNVAALLPIQCSAPARAPRCPATPSPDY
jgi:hypothetical protein